MSMTTKADIDTAIEKSMARTKASMMRTRTAAKKAVLLPDKVALGEMAKALECQLRKMRQGVFDIEETAYGFISNQAPGEWVVSGFYYLDQLMNQRALKKA